MTQPIVPFSRVKTGIGATLIKITHPDLAEPMYICDNNESITYQNTTYEPYFFTFEAPEQTDDTDGTATLTISAVDRQIINIIRSASSNVRPIVEIMAIWIDNDENNQPVFSELSGYIFEVAGAEMDAKSATLTLTVDTLCLFDFPGDEFTSSNCFGGVK